MSSGALRRLAHKALQQARQISGCARDEQHRLYGGYVRPHDRKPAFHVPGLLCGIDGPFGVIEAGLGSSPMTVIADITGVRRMAPAMRRR